MTTTARAGLPRPHARAGYAAPLLPVRWARLVAYAPLVVFCACMWSRTIDPARVAQMLGAAGLAIAAAVALLRVRGAWRVAVALAGIAGALLVAGVAPRLLLPGGWGELLAGLGAGFGDLPTTNVPYRGSEAWTITVLLLIGALIAALSAWLGFAPRRAGDLRGPGPAAVALGVLFTVPAVQVEGGHPWLEGIALAVMLCAFLRLERVERHGAPTALAVVVVAGLAAAVAAPRLDVGGPLLNPESLANAFAPSRGLQFSWDHTYGPLAWPRTGREVLRIKAKTASYWKVENLSRFDGLHWIEPRELGPTDQEATADASQRDWHSDIHVRVRGLSTRLFVGAGTTLAIYASPRTPIRNAPGTFRTGPLPLHEGQSYDATVWNPRPTRQQLRAAKGELPAWTWQYLRIDLPPAEGGPVLSPTPGSVLRTPETAQISFPGYAVHTPPFIDSRWPGQPPRDAGGIVRRSVYGGVYRLAEQLRVGTTSPYAYVTRVLAHLADGGYRYSETPPKSAVPLAAFLTRDKQGYCQQFSGAMALLLRMEGVPARVATGFSPGTLDRNTGEYVVHDTDAHSWVEAYIAPFGWVTFDPTPPVGPARLTPGVGNAASAYQLAAPAGVLGAAERVGDRNPGGGKVDDGSPLRWILGGVGAAILLGVVGVLLLRRRRGPARVDTAVAELRAALEGTGRTSTGGLTLHTMLRRYRGTPAEPYLRTLEAARFAGADAVPTPAMRSAMRRELVLGLGPLARLGAWRAIPPALVRASRPRSTYADDR